MMKKKQLNIDGMVQRNNTSAAAAMEGLEWEMRPGGMLVQKRNTDPSSHRNSDSTLPTTGSTIRALVKFNSSYRDIQINPHSSFGGELKKMLVGGPQQDQKMIYKDKERDSRDYPDINVGVEEYGSNSRIFLTKDVITSHEKTFLEHKRAKASIDGALKSVAAVTMEVDKLATQVTKLEGVVAKGGMVSEKELLNLTELLMSQLIKLDGIEADGNTKLTRKKQVIRVQGYIETLDRLNARNGIARLLQQQKQQQERRK